VTTTRQTAIRPARADDAAAIAAIYNQAVTTSTATFDLEPVTVESRVRWLTEHDDKHPVLVAERDGAVVAWGSLSSVSDRGAWDATVEISTYVDEGHLGAGLGRLLGIALIEAAVEAGHHVVMSRVCAENEASIHLAGRLGFTLVGTLHEVGRKFDRWLDVVILERRVQRDSPGSVTPSS
jgi:L-amino acid N-acyltransferase